MDNKLQLWALYLGSLSAFGPYFDIETIKKHKGFWSKIKSNNYTLPKSIIYGVIDDSSKTLEKSIRNRVLEYVVMFNKADTKDNLLYKVNSLVNEPPQYLKKKLQEYRFMNHDKRQSLIDKAETKGAKKHFGKIITNIDSLSKHSIDAYYLANAITLCRHGGLLGMLTTDEVLNKVNEIAKIAHTKYVNYDDFAVSARIGYFMHSTEMFSRNENYSFYVNYDIIIDLRCLIWNHIPWPNEFTL